LSIALGVFIGISPFWGFQTALVIFLALALKLNKVISFTFSNVSLPIFIPFIVYGSFQVGALLLGAEPVINNLSDINIQNINFSEHLSHYLVGSFSLAISLALLFGVIGYITLLAFSKKEK